MWVKHRHTCVFCLCTQSLTTVEEEVVVVVEQIQAVRLGSLCLLYLAPSGEKRESVEEQKRTAEQQQSWDQAITCYMWYCHHCPPPPPQSVHLTQCPAVYCCLLFTFQTSIPPLPPLLRPLLPPPSPQEQQSVVAPITTITRARASTSSSAPVAAAAAARDDSPGANSRNSSTYISCTCDSGNH